MPPVPGGLGTSAQTLKAPQRLIPTPGQLQGGAVGAVQGPFPPHGGWGQAHPPAAAAPGDALSVHPLELWHMPRGAACRRGG